MVITTARFSFKYVLAALSAGAPISTGDLQGMGIAPYQASYLARHGWLTHLGRGVYVRAGDVLERDACIDFLARSIPGLHVGGKTALAWRGVTHNIAFREKVSFWGEKSTRFPTWFTERFACTYQTTRLFSGLPADFGLQTLPAGHSHVLVSVPERALLEMLSDVGKMQSLDEATKISESIRSLRETMLDELLSHVARVKVVRLLFETAKETGQPWAELALEHSKRLGGGKRWQAVTRTGERITLKRP